MLATAAITTLIHHITYAAIVQPGPQVEVSVRAIIWMIVVKAMLILHKQAVSMKFEVNWLATWRENRTARKTYMRRKPMRVRMVMTQKMFAMIPSP